MSGLFERLVARSVEPAAAMALRPRIDPVWRNAGASQPQEPMALAPSPVTATHPPLHRGTRAATAGLTVPPLATAPAHTAPAVASVRPPAIERAPLGQTAPIAHGVRVPVEALASRAEPSESVLPPARPRGIADFQTDEGVPPRRVPSSPRLPVALLTPVQPSRLPTAVPAMATASKREPAASAAAAEPDVHIHIGRIELSAIVPTAEPRSTPARTAPAVTSLEDYLQGRRGLGAA